MPDKIEPLLYRGITMRSDAVVRASGFTPPSTMTVAEMRELLYAGKTLHLTFEPGDVTSYRLVLSPFHDAAGQPGLVVTRLGNGGSKVWAGVLWDWDEGASAFQFEEVARYIGRGHEWCEQLFKWWLRVLCTRDDR